MTVGQVASALLAVLLTVAIPGTGAMSANRSAGILPTGVRPPARAFDFDGNGKQDLVLGGNKRLLVYEYRRSGLSDPHRVRPPQFAALEQATFPAFASADLDRDGFADLVAGAPDTEFDPARDGSILVLFGSPDGLTTRGSYLVRGPSERRGFGMALAAADFNSDGWTDVAVGAPDPYPIYGEPEKNTSAVVVLWGGSGRFALDRSYVIDKPSPETTYFGLELAAGDVNGDGAVDLVEHNPWGSPQHATWSPGSATGPASPRAFGAGKTMVVGDVTADGVDDIILGQPRGSGAVTLHRGSSDGPLPGVQYTQDSPGVADRVEDGDNFGYSLAIVKGRLGRADLLVASRHEDKGGAVTVLQTGAGGLAARGSYRIDQEREGIPGRSKRHEHFGLLLSTLQLDGRGRQEVILLMRKRIPAAVTGARVSYSLVRLFLFAPLRDGDVWVQFQEDVPDGWG